MHHHETDIVNADDRAVQSTRTVSGQRNKKGMLMSEQKTKRRGISAKYIIGIVIAILVGLFSYDYFVIAPKNRYNAAMNAFAHRDYANVANLLESNNYQDSYYYAKVIRDIENKNYSSALDSLPEIADEGNRAVLNDHLCSRLLEDIKNQEADTDKIDLISEEYFEDHKGNIYNCAGELLGNNLVSEAKSIYEKLGDYKNAGNYINYCDGIINYRNANRMEALAYFEKCGGFSNAAEWISGINKERLQGNLGLDEAIAILESMPERTSEEQDLLDKCNEMKQYEGLYVAYAASRNNRGVREYQNYDWSRSKYQRELTFQCVSGEIEAYLNGERLGYMQETEGHDPIQPYPEYHQFKYACIYDDLFQFGPGDTALWCSTYYGPDASGGNPLTLYMRLQK